MMPDHCKGCVLFHNARHKNPTAELRKFNAWCCAAGKPAEKSVGWCRQHNMKNGGER